MKVTALVLTLSLTWVGVGAVLAGLAGALTVAGGAVLPSITGAMVAEARGAYPLLGMMLFCSLMGLLAALYVRRIDRLEGPTGAADAAEASPPVQAD